MNRSTYREHEAKFNAACSWLMQLGIRIDGTRVAEYSRLLHEITEFHEAENMDALFAKRDKAELYNALIESSEFVYIHEGLQNHADSSLSQSLRRFVSGTALLASETADNNRPRNIGFELTVASAAMRAKLPVALNPPSDFEINLGSTSVPIECKRPFTSRKVERNVSDGLDQLGQRYDASTKSKRARGILAISITRTENDGSKRLEGDTPADLVNQMCDICRAFVTRHQHHWLERVDGRTLAILLELSAPSIVRKSSVFSTTRQYVWVSLCERGSKDRQTLELVARPFETLNTENRARDR